MNLSGIHAWRKSNVKSVFRINCTKILINFIVLPNIMHNQTRHTVRDGFAVEKNQYLQGKLTEFYNKL